MLSLRRGQNDIIGQQSIAPPGAGAGTKLPAGIRCAAMSKYALGAALIAVMVSAAGCAYRSTSGSYAIHSAIPVPAGFYQRLGCAWTRRC